MGMVASSPQIQRWSSPLLSTWLFWELKRRAEGKAQGLNWRGALKMWGRESTWGLRDFPFSVPSSNPCFLYFFLNSPPLLPCAAFQAAAVPGQCLCLSGSGQVYPGLGEVEVSSRRWVQFWHLHWRRGLGGLEVWAASQSLAPGCVHGIVFSPSRSPEEIYGNWSMPLNTSHIWHPRIREVGKEIGFEGRAKWAGQAIAELCLRRWLRNLRFGNGQVKVTIAHFAFFRSRVQSWCPAWWRW